MKKVTIVYYGYINSNVQWWNIMGGQLTHLKQTGILEIANLYIHITSENEEDKTIALLRIKELLPDCILSSSSINQYEYDGIYLVWKLAHENPENIFLYFHSKQMSHGLNERGKHERQLFQETIESWKTVLRIFETDSTINKVGLTASEKGWMWFNFWWARGIYLIKCEKPIITPLRHYYEDWLHRKLNDFPPSTYEDCYSLADYKSGICYTPSEACAKADAIQLISTQK